MDGDSGWRRSICPYCGTGCGLRVRAENGVVTRVEGDPDHSVNAGRLCAKGALLAPVLVTEDRLLYPQARDRTTGASRRLDWDAAIGTLAAAIRRAVAEHGPDAVMLYGSGQLLTEDYYLFGKLAKGFIGTNNQDTNSRLCMASAVAAYTLALGKDAPPAAYADIEQANTFLIVGANMEACHPILFNRVKARKRAGGGRVKVIVIDPRATETAAIADVHLAVRPGADVPLLNALLYEAVLAGGLDRDFIAAHTTGWEQFRSVLPKFQAELVEDVTGVPAQAIVDAARIYAANGPALSFWSMGVNQSTNGVEKNLALINLSLATGNIGRPGAGPFSLTGQPNAMGGREAGGLATTLPGHRLVADAADRAEVEAFWGLPPGAISPRPGLTAIEMVEALEAGRIKVLWIAGTNPLASLPNAARGRTDGRVPARTHHRPRQGPVAHAHAYGQAGKAEQERPRALPGDPRAGRPRARHPRRPAGTRPLAPGHIRGSGPRHEGDPPQHRLHSLPLGRALGRAQRRQPDDRGGVRPTLQAAGVEVRGRARGAMLIRAADAQPVRV